MPGVRINIPVEVQLPADPAGVTDDVDSAGKAVPSLPTSEDVTDAPKDKPQAPSVTKKDKAIK
jgi:hypothetical protein